MRLIFALFVLGVALFASPKWYENLTTTKPNSYIGYGSSTKEKEAKRDALSDIASQISLKVVNSFSDDISEIDGKVSSKTYSKTSQDSSATLNDYKLLRSSYLDGRFYVAMEYENITSLDRFVRKLKRLKVNKKSEKQNSYIKKTLMAKSLKKDLLKDIDFKLVRKDKEWFIKYNSILQRLDKKDFAKFFVSISNKDLSINTNKKENILYDGDRFFFKVNSKKSGFVSIFSVYEDGTVSTLIRNIKISKNKTENIPDEEFESIPEAGLMEQGVETYDLYVVVYDRKKLHFDQFAYADDKLIKEEKYKNFDELIEFLDTKDYATLKVVTKPR